MLEPGNPPLLPMFFRGKWLNRPPTHQELTNKLRHLLTMQGVDPIRAAVITPHGLKATVLSWCAKANVKQEVRRVLGYHAQKGEKMMHTYARDSQSGPLRELNKLLACVRSGKFFPDNTRSGMWTDPLLSDDGALMSPTSHS